jgi:hypothetical protein
MTDDQQRPQPTRRRRARQWAYLAIVLVLVYLLVAYLLVPLAWEGYSRWHPSFDDNPRLTQTSDGHPGDPLNVALIGTEPQVRAAMQEANWFPAAALGLRSDLKIAADTVLSRSDDEAPVSSLFLFGRREDLAFEQPVGDNPRQRHHVRFWRTAVPDSDGRPTWIGSASYDARVGLSHTTGQITHHIAPDVDAERDHLFDGLENAGAVAEFYTVDNFHTVREGRNGGGDRWHTDGRLFVGRIAND